MTLVQHKKRSHFGGILSAVAVAAVVIGGIAYWYASADRTMEMARLDDGITVTTAPVTEDTPGPTVNDIDHARGSGLQNGERFAPLPDAARNSPPH